MDIAQYCTFPPYADFRTSLLKKVDPCAREIFFTIVNKKLQENSLSNIRYILLGSIKFNSPKKISDISVYYGFDEHEFKKIFCIDNGQLVARDSGSTSVGDFLQHQLHTCPKKYEDSRHYFTKNCFNMLEYLREYNLMDTRLLSESIVRYADGFLQQWGVDIHEFMSVCCVFYLVYLL